MGNQWRLLDTGCRDGFTNMALDEAILTAVSNGLAPPTLRFYGWSSPTLTLGYFQETRKEIDLTACQRLGVQVVRRLTGGRAVLHHREVTYSIIAPMAHPDMRGSVLECYLRLSQGLLAGYRNLGVKAKLATAPPGKTGSAACFDTPSWYELTAQGKKIAGSAQTRRMGCILQHGSLPLSLNNDLLLQCLHLPSDSIRERLTGTLTRHAAGINQLLDRPVSYPEMIQALAEGWQQALGWQLEPGDLTTSELSLARKLIHSRYKTAAWNMDRQYHGDILPTISLN